MYTMEKILVLGAGFGGIRTALDLEKRLSKKAQITLVSNSHYHCYIPDLYDVATARLKNQDGYNSLKASVALHLEDLFKNKNITVIISKVLGINLPAKEVRLETQILTYDWLVIALGSTSAYFGIKGADQNSHPLKSAEDALKVRDDLDKLVSTSKEQGKTVNVAIAGGGFTGVEIAGALGKLLGSLGTITMVEAGNGVLGGMPDWARRKALEKLQELKVSIRLDCPIKEVTASEILTDNGNIPFNYLIWTAGIKGIDLAEGIKGVELGKKNQIPVGEDLSVPGYPNVFVVGDMAQVGSPEKGFVPQTAWAAIAEAKVAAENICLKMEGKNTRPFVSPKNEFVVPIGELFALTNAFGLKIEGAIAWMIKEFIALRYLISITGIKNAFQTWRKEIEVDILDH